MKINSIFISLSLFAWKVFAEDCAISGLQSGLNVDYYENYRSPSNWTDVPADMEAQPISYSRGGVSSLAFNNQFYESEVSDKYRAGAIYGHSMDINRFGLIYTGYFYAANDGDYTFSYTLIDDFVYFKLAEAKSLDCCDNSEPAYNPEWSLNNKGLWNQKASFTAKLEGGKYYKMKGYYFNEVYASSMSLVYSYNGGTATHNLPVYNFDLDKQPMTCNPIQITSTVTGITTPTTIHYTGTGTTPGSDVVLVPISSTTITSTSTDYSATKTSTTLICFSDSFTCTELELNPPEYTTTTSICSEWLFLAFCNPKTRVNVRFKHVGCNNTKFECLLSTNDCRFAYRVCQSRL